jgi:hypothetical protein
MATTTTNYGWAIPQSTDLVKDGATAIATLGSAIDTSINTALGTKKAGMVLLNTTSFSAVSTVSAPANTFTSTYDHYRIVWNVTASAASNTEMQFRLRASGTDDTATNYHFSTYGLRVNGATGQFSGTGVNKWSFTYGATGARQSASIDIYAPKLAQLTKYTCLSFGDDGTAAIQYHSGGYFNATTSFDSFSIIPMASNMTGEMSVYGYNK